MPEERARLRRDPTPTVNEYETGLRINEHQLQVECRNQPELFYQIARAVANARAEYEDAKTHFKRVSAEIELNTRRTFDEGEIRVTEGRILALVAENQVVMRAGDHVNDCRAKMEDLEALKEAYMQRKDMLRELVQLFISNYYADPTRGNENRMRDAAVEGVRAARRREREREESRRR